VTVFSYAGGGLHAAEDIKFTFPFHTTTRRKLRLNSFSDLEITVPKQDTSLIFSTSFTSTFINFLFALS
jgi:hypothetical protein